MSRRRSRGGRNRRSSQSSSFKNVLKASAVALIPLAVIGVGGYIAAEHMKTEKIDQSYCFDRLDQHQVAFLIETSFLSNMSESQVRDLNNALDSVFDDLPPNGKVSIFSTFKSDASTIVKPVFSVCRPSRTTLEQADLGAPDKSTAMLAREYNEAAQHFADQVDEVMMSAKDAKHAANSSPILEQIQGVSRARFSSELTKLIVFSDGVNNSENGRFCSVKGDLPPYRVFKDKPAYRYIKPDEFNGADIEFLMVQDGRKSPYDMKHCTWLELQNFWVDYFEGNGAGNVTLTPLGVGAVH